MHKVAGVLGWRRGWQPRRVGRGRGVGVPGRGGDQDLVAVAEQSECLPAGGFLGVVAGLAEALAVLGGGLAAVDHPRDVVGVADGGVAPRRAADLVADDEELAQLAVEGAAAGVHRDQGVRVGVGVEAAEPGAGRLADDVAGQGGVDRAVADDAGGGGVVGEQRAVGHDDLHLDVDIGRVGPSGGPLDQGVGHDLTAGADVTVATRGVGGVLEGGEAGHALLDGQEGGQVAHRVGSGPQADVSVGPCAASTTDGGAGVEAVADGSGPGRCLAVTEVGQLGGELGVDLGTVLDRQDGRLAHDQGGAPLADLAAAQQGVGVGHLADERPRRGPGPAHRGEDCSAAPARSRRPGPGNAWRPARRARPRGRCGPPPGGR